MNSKLQLWPIFICYRRVDGAAVARRLHEMLDKLRIVEPENQPIQLDVYLDETMPGVENWKELHRPYLEKARAIIVICTPGSKLNEGENDWVHLEIEWWLRQRDVAPILIDPLMEGLRYVPSQIIRRWPDIQRIALVEEEWKGLSGAELDEKVSAVRRQILGVILPSGAEIYAQELEQERRRTRRLKQTLTMSLVLLIVAGILGGYAFYKGQVAKASGIDSHAARLFAQARLLEMRKETEVIRRDDLIRRLSTSQETSIRWKNLSYELQQIKEELRLLKTKEAAVLAEGRDRLRKADNTWNMIDAFGFNFFAFSRDKPKPPHIFSIELVNAGYGESILVHYGTPDGIKLVMINGGPRGKFKNFVEPRLRQLGLNRFEGAPVPIELFIVSDRDEEKTGGLLSLLQRLVESNTVEERLVDIRGIWANIFQVVGGRELMRPRIRRLINELGIPLNKPFDYFVMRPDQGQVVVALPGGLEIIVLGPIQGSIDKLHAHAERDARRSRGTIERLDREAFSAVDINLDPARFSITPQANNSGDGCIPSVNAQNLVGGSYTDESVPNLASTILLFRYRGKSFLYTGDARGDLILEGLNAAGLLDSDGNGYFDLLTIPHLGSKRNITFDFFKRVKASGYLFSGDGRHGNPDIATVASLISARGCDFYRMYFVNRDGKQEVHGKKFDDFFEKEESYNPSYRRVFRSLERGSVIIDLLNPIRH